MAYEEIDNLVELDEPEGSKYLILISVSPKWFKENIDGELSV